MSGHGGISDLPQWYMPPRAIGGHVTGLVLIGRSDRCVVAVRQVLAYPVGVEIEIEAHARGSASHASSDDLHRQPRFHVRFADGREAAQDDESGLRSGQGPMMVVSRYESSSGGPEKREDVRLALWIWPLPQPGLLTLTCSWAEHGFHDASLVLDGDDIRAAAGRAQPFWPDSSS